MICSLCPKTAVYDFGAESLLCAHCMTALLKRCKISNPKVASSGVTAGAQAPVSVPAVTIHSDPAHARAFPTAPQPAADDPSRGASAAFLFDDGIPPFLKRGNDNVPPFARAAT